MIYRIVAGVALFIVGGSFSLMLFGLIYEPPSPNRDNGLGAALITLFVVSGVGTVPDGIHELKSGSISITKDRSNDFK